MGTEKDVIQQDIDRIWEYLGNPEGQIVYSNDDYSESIFGIEQVQDLVLERFNEGVDFGEDMSGFLPGIGKLWRPSKKTGSVVVGTGYPGHGKSLFMDGVSVYLAKEKGWVVVLASFENMPPSHYMMNCLIPKWLKKKKSGLTADLIKQALEEMKNKVFILNPAENKRDIQSLIGMAEKISMTVRKKGQGMLFVIDPWNECEWSRDTKAKRLSESEYISQSLSWLRIFAKQNAICCTVIAHPVKVYPINSSNMKLDKDGFPIGNTIPRPSLTHISGSHTWRSKADVGWTVWRYTHPALDGNPVNEAEFSVLKSRFQDIARIGRCSLKFDPDIERFY